MFRKSLSLFALALVGTMLSTGCLLEIDPYAYDYDTGDTESLKINWTIDGSSSASLCNYYGVDKWKVEVEGPSTRSIYVDCRYDNWASSHYIGGMVSGYYTVSVTALDENYAAITTYTSGLNLYRYGDAERLDFDFADVDFY
jgi:hypothetical protein